MALFSDFPDDTSRPRRGNGWIGWFVVALVIGAIAFVGLMPTNYVIERPGPVFDTLGDVIIDGQATPMINIPNEETYPTEGALDLLTVSTNGNPNSTPNWFEVALASIDPSRAILPLEDVYPPGYSVEDSAEQGRVDMANSQNEAIAAALTRLVYDVPSTLTIVDIREGSPAEGVLEEDDTIVSFEGQSFDDVSQLRAAIADHGTDSPAIIRVIRDGETLDLEITPVLSDAAEPAPIIGVVIAGEYDFPVEVDIQLQNVGGPSAGMMFALGIIDKLTEGSLTGGEHIAGTGTITAAGVVGPIGGVVQKMHGAVNNGARWMFVPQANCSAVVGNIPDHLTVIPVETLDDALDALEVISSGGSTEALPTCSAG